MVIFNSFLYVYQRVAARNGDLSNKKMQHLTNQVDINQSANIFSPTGYPAW